jgi:hypothetical protein
MLETEQQIIKALETWISRNAAERMLGRVLSSQKRSAQSLVAADWADLIEGPLLKELVQVFPIYGLVGPLGGLVKELRSASRSAVAVAERPAVQKADKAQVKADIPIAPKLAQAPAPAVAQTPTEWIVVNDEAVRRALVQEMARLDGVLAVVLETPKATEMRALNFNKGLPRLISMSHRLLALRGNYRVLYATYGNGQLLIRPLGSGWLAILTKPGANLGQLLYRLRYMEAQTGGE